MRIIIICNSGLRFRVYGELMERQDYLNLTIAIGLNVLMIYRYYYTNKVIQNRPSYED